MTEKECLQKEKELIKQLKEKYPPGTIFYPIGYNKKVDRSKIHIVQKSWKAIANYMDHPDEVYGFFNTSSGMHAHDGYIMLNDKWAKKCVIVETNE